MLAWAGIWLKAALIAVIVGAQCSCESRGGISLPTASSSSDSLLSLRASLVLERLRGGGVKLRDQKRAGKFQQLKQVRECGSVATRIWEISFEFGSGIVETAAAA
jgi:hypothetical protein